MWVCSQCTLENTAQSSACEVCGFVPPVVVATPSKPPPPPYESSSRPLSEFVGGESGGGDCSWQIRVISEGSVFQESARESSDAARQRLRNAIRSVVLEDGRSSGASPSYVENTANEPNLAAGPRRAAANGRKNTPTTSSRLDGGGARVNAATNDGAVYDNSPVVKQELASHRVVSKADASVAVEIVDSSTESKAPLALEVAAVGEKLRNMAKVGGERVKEMDHVVDSVETEVVDLVDNGSSKLTARKALERADRRSRLKSADGDVEVIFGCQVEKPAVLSCAKILGSVLSEALIVLDRSSLPVQLYCLPTVRANEFVCTVEDDGTLYVNVLPFQQASGGRDDKTNPFASPIDWPTLLPYWCQRIATALNEFDSSSSDEKTKKPQQQHTPGLYDSRVRTRLADRLFELAGEAPGFESWLHTSNPRPLEPIDDDNLLVAGQA